MYSTIYIDGWSIDENHAYHIIERHFINSCGSGFSGIYGYHLYKDGDGSGDGLDFHEDNPSLA